MKEIWKVYKDSRAYLNGNQYGDLWEVSNFGRVKKNGVLYECKRDQNGYNIFCGRKVYRAVAELFVPNPENKNEVDHIDTNRANDNANNLQWVTHKENLNNPLTINRIKSWHTEEYNKNISDKRKQWHQTHKMMLCEDGKRHWVEI